MYQSLTYAENIIMSKGNEPEARAWLEGQGFSVPTMSGRCLHRS